MLFDCRKLLLAVWGVDPESEAESVRFPWVQSDKAGPESRKLPPEELASRSELGDLEIWFVDECGVEGDPRPRRRWSALGSRPKVPYLEDQIRATAQRLHWHHMG
jgi:hypothetical protein